MSDPNVPPRWFEDAFHAAYLTVYAHRDDASADREIDFVVTSLGATSGASVLDAGCGAGRHSRALCKRGVRPIGLDLSEDLLRSALTHDESGPVVRADLRALPFRPAAFDHVVSLFTTFGYFDDADNRRQLAEMRRVTSPRGRLVLDFLNAERVIATLVPRSERESDGRRVIEERAIRAGRVEKDVRVLDEANHLVRSWRESVRLYDRSALEAEISAAGWRVRDVVGDLTGGEWSSDAPRTVVVAEAA